MTEREQALMSLKKTAICVACRETIFLFPKGVGYQPYVWEMNCNICHRYNLGVNAYLPAHKELYTKLKHMRERYIKGETSEALASEMNALSVEYDHTLDNRLCECGGQLSILAKPKCIFCDVEVFDSYFHYSDEL